MNDLHTPPVTTARPTFRAAVAGLLLGCLLALVGLTTASARAAQLPLAAPPRGLAPAGEPPYEQRVPALIASIDGFWRQRVRGYVSPGLQPGYETTGVTCGGEAIEPGNAEYCFPGRFITWDETNLTRPYYEKAGDMAVGFVLAHEWGHAIQDQLGQRFRLNIFAELEADCFAGAWLRNLYTSGQADVGDVQEAAWAIRQIGDPPGTRIDDPDAHGSSKLRGAWVAYGFKRGVHACYARTQQVMRAG